MPGWDWGGGSNQNDDDDKSSNNNQGSDSGNSRFDVGSGYYGEPTTNSSPSDNNYKDPILNMVDPSKIPGTPDYIEQEKIDYVTMPEKKLKMSKGVRPEMVVTLEEKKVFDRIDEQVDKVTGSLGYQLEKRIANFAKNKIPLGFLLPTLYPERTIAGDRIGDQDIPMDRPDEPGDFKKPDGEKSDKELDFILSQIAMGNNNWQDDPSWWANLPESQANKYFQGMDQDNNVNTDYLNTHNAAVARINGLLKDNNKYEISKNNGIFKDWLTGKGLI